MIDYDEQEREFAPLVGRAILNFGRIEFSTLQAAEILSNETIIKTAAQLTFSKRANLLIEILSGKRKKGSAVERLIRLLRQALVGQRGQGYTLHIDKNQSDYLEGVCHDLYAFNTLERFITLLRAGMNERTSSKATGTGRSS